MKALLSIGEFKDIELIPEIQITDVMDGTPDTLTVSFIYPEDITPKLKLKDEAVISIQDDLHIYEKIGYIDFNKVSGPYTGEITFKGETYSIYLNNIYQSGQIKGTLNYNEQTILINNEAYSYDNNNYIWDDKRKFYYMCLSQISSQINSTKANNGYQITVSLKEQTVYLKDCIRSDIAITPSLYPELPSDVEENKQIYPTLLEATYKVCDRHNMILLNKKIQSLDEDLISALKSVSCPNLTYKDLSTYDQLYDIFMRVGRVPYFERGQLFGIKLTGNRPDVENNFSMLNYRETQNGVTVITDGNTIKLNGTSTEDFYFKLPLLKPIIAGTYNVVFIKHDFDVTFYPAIYFMDYPLTTVSTSDVTEDGTLTFGTDFDVRAIRITIPNGQTYENSELTMYIIKGDTLEVEFSDIITGTSVSSIKEEGVNQNIYSTKVYNNQYDEEVAVVPSIFTATIQAPFAQVSSTKKGSMTESEVETWFETELRKWTWLNSRNEVDAKALLSISNYNSDSNQIEDVRNYGLILPSNIERILNVYKVSPYVTYSNTNDTLSFGFFKVPVGCKLLENGEVISDNISDTATFTVSGIGTITYKTFCDQYGNGEVSFNGTTYVVKNYEFTINGRTFEILENSRLLEYKTWSELSSLQQAQFSYYESGSNEIKRVICMVSNNIEYLAGSFSWSSADLYNELKQWFYIVVYKPILDQPYINYEYNLVSNGLENKPLDVNTYNLPYKSVTDKQVYPLLEYNLEKGTDTSHTLKVITKNPILLNYTASDIILVYGKPYIINQIEMNINNKSIEATLTLSDNIVVNSILSSFRDSVRVSSNLSTETTVTASIPILSEQVIYLDNRPSSNVLTEERKMTADNDYFTQNIGKYMSTQAMYDLGMPLSKYGEYYKDVYRYLLKYPMRFSKIVNADSIISQQNYNFSITINSDKPYENSTFGFVNFPIYARRREYVVFGVGNYTGDTITINSYEELQRLNNDEFKMYVRYQELPTTVNINRVVKDLFKGDLSINSFLDNRVEFIDGYVWYDFSKDGSNWVQLRPEMWEGENANVTELESLFNRYSTDQGWTKVINHFNFDTIDLSPAKRPYSIYASYVGSSELKDTLNVYATEGIISQSGDITSFTYMLNNPAYLNNRYTTSSIPDGIVSTALGNPNNIYRAQPSFSKTDPIYYNQSESGCRIEGFGSEYDDVYGFGILNSYTPSNYGLIMDLREIPQVYLQFKTMALDSDVIEIKELNKDINYLQTKVPYETESENDTYFLIQIPKQMKLKDFVFDKETIDSYRVVDQKDTLNNFIQLYNLSLGTFTMNPIDDPNAPSIRRNPDYDYVLLQTNSSNRNTFDDVTFARPIVKFNIIGDNEIQDIVFHMEIRNSYEGIAHNKYLKQYKSEATVTNVADSTVLNLGKVDGLYDMYNSTTGFKTICSVRITESVLIGTVNGQNTYVDIDVVNVGELIPSNKEITIKSSYDDNITYSLKASANDKDELMIIIRRNTAGSMKSIWVVSDSIYEEV